MIPRYQTAVMRQWFSDDTKYQTWFMVELAYLEALSNKWPGLDDALLKRLQARSQSIDWRQFADKVVRYEQETRHDVIAFLKAIEDELGTDARFIHMGLTSSDIVDTAWAVVFKNASLTLDENIKGVILALWQQAQRFKGVMCLGRTHGQAAEPTTFGIKLLGHVAEFIRGYERFCSAKDACLIGKLSGAVGVYALVEPAIEQQALAHLGLHAETVSTQVVARDRHAAFFASCAVLAGSIERLAVEIRLLMHGQVKEVSEPFFAHQKGSSAMPHKKNPIISENLTGLMRLIRSYSLAAFENQALWHERDISHSSVERVIIPDVFHVLDFALTRLTNLLNNWVIDTDRMKANLDDAGDVLLSQSVMFALIKKGLMRQEAYDLVQTAALAQHHDFKTALHDAGIARYLSSSELLQVFSAVKKVPHEEVLFDRVAVLVKGALVA